MKGLSGTFWGLAPAYAVMGVMAVIPLAIIVYVSFMTSDPYGGFKHIVSFASYRQLLFNEGWEGELEFNPQYAVIFARTVLLASATTLVCLLVAFPVAYFISRRSAAAKALLLYLVTLPFWVSMVVRVYAWLLILGDEGVLEKGLKLAGLVSDVNSMLYTNSALMVGMVYSYIPLMILPIYAGVEKVPGELIEASHDLYASRARTFSRVIVPLCKPGMMAGAVLVFVPALGTVLEPTLLGGGKQMMLGNLIQNQFGVARNWSFGATIAIALLCTVMVFLTVQARRASGSFFERA